MKSLPNEDLSEGEWRLLATKYDGHAMLYRDEYEGSLRRMQLTNKGLGLFNYCACEGKHCSGNMERSNHWCYRCGARYVNYYFY